MNLFVTSSSPVLSAQALDNKRVVNQIRETCQLISTALIERGINHPSLTKAGYANHPVTKWVCSSDLNLAWTVEHARALHAEKAVRWPNNRPHARSEGMLPFLAELFPALPAFPYLIFCNCAGNAALGLDFKSDADVPRAYRRYMMQRWRTDKRPPVWSNRGEPSWGYEEEV
jgi:hypothetical protein